MARSGELKHATGGPNGAHGSADKPIAIAALAALGVVFGDIGTSPLYALRECFHLSHGLALNETSVLGILSLIIWSLILVVTIKYVAVVLRADNKGEGGILSLLSQVAPSRGISSKFSTRIFIALGLFGAALLYGDGVITPAISVLSAIEGVKIATPALEGIIIPVTVTIIVGLFLIQRRGTASIGKTFGPIILLWFSSMAVLGLVGIAAEPRVFAALNPYYGLAFFFEHKWIAFKTLGSVMLVITGGEALYADLGHFGKRPIRLGWLAIVLPALALQYLGQGALLLTHPEAIENPFFMLAPAWARMPMVLLATLASIIASQAMITGAFSLSQQAVQLGYLPRIEVRHTSADEKGQIYVPFINWALLAGTLFLVFEFRSSSNLAAAYGIAVTGTMTITSVLTFVVMRRRWRWKLWQALPLTALFFLIDLSFLSANALKFFDGGWFPIALASLVFVCMTVWKDGRRLLAERLAARSQPVEKFLEDVVPKVRVRVPGVAVFLTAVSKGTPAALLHNVRHNQILHKTVVILTISTDEVPHVPKQERITVQGFGKGFYRVIAKYGFMESPNVPEVLTLCAPHGLVIDESIVTYYLGRETLVATKRPGMAIWREKIFAFMTRNAQRATDYFQIPAERAIEIGAVVEL